MKIADVLKWSITFLTILAPLSRLCASTVIDVHSFGATGDGVTDDCGAIQSALDAAAAQSTASEPVEVYFPGGRYLIVSHTLAIPGSDIELVGDPNTPSVIVNSIESGPGSWLLDTNPQPSTAFQYLAIARADDPAIPAVPGKSYKGLNYIYLKDRAQVAVLRGLGVPGSLTPGYAGLKVCLASGATLDNNGPALVDAAPISILQGTSQVNPTPVDFTQVLAADNTGRVSLSDPNRYDWGASDPDIRPSNESLDDYYSPNLTPGYEESHSVVGPAWLVPANGYHHEIDFKSLTFAEDTTRPRLLRKNNLVFVGRCYNISVRDCKFIDNPGAYEVLALRCDNVWLDHCTFDVSDCAATFDSGSNFVVSNCTFSGSAWPNAPAIKAPAEALNFIDYDEMPEDVTLIGNRFSNLPVGPDEPKQSGRAVSGDGGSFSKYVDNEFDDVDGVAFGQYRAKWIIEDGNRLVACKAALDHGGGGATCFRHSNQPPVPESTARPQLLASIISLKISPETLVVNEKASITVTLSQPAAEDYPFYLLPSDGEFGTASLNGFGDPATGQGFLFRVLKGQSSITILQAVKALRTGHIEIAARPLQSVNDNTAVADLTVTRTRR